MNVIVVPPGESGWNKKTAVLASIVAGAPNAPLLRNDVLIIVPTSRMRRTYGRLLLALAGRAGCAALVPPDLMTLHQFFGRLYARVPGPALIDETSRLILLEGMIKEKLEGDRRFPLSPDILAPSLSSSLAAMIEQLAAADVSPARLLAAASSADLADRPQVAMLADVYRDYLDALRIRGLTDPAGMRSLLRERSDPSVLAKYRAVVIDGLPDAGQVEAELISRIAACADCTLLIEAPSPGHLAAAPAFHPLAAAPVVLARLGAALPAADTPPPADLAFLADALFAESPFDSLAAQAPPAGEFGRDIRILSAVTIREEISLIAGEIKRSLRKGTPPDEILVAFPSLDEYGPAVEEIFTDYGIPYNRALGRQLSGSPVATALISLLRCRADDFSGPSLVRVVGSPFLKFSEAPEIAPALDRFLRKRRIAGGREKILRALKRLGPDERETAGVLAGPLTDLASALAPFSDDAQAPLGGWMDRLGALIAWSGLKDRCAVIKGPLNMNLQAYRKLMEVVTSLTGAAQLFPEYRYTFPEWLFLLKKTFMHARFQVPPDDEGGVQILGIEESAGRPWAEVYLGGAVDGAFPRRMPQNIFLPEATLEGLGMRTLAQERLKAAGHFYRLILSATKVTVTRPENAGDRPTMPSPFLMELEPLRRAGLVNRGVTTTSGIQFNLAVEESASLPELAKALALAGPVAGADKVLHAVPGGGGIFAALTAQPPEAAPFTPPVLKREFSVTELDDYLACPYSYYVRSVLGVKPLEEVSEDLTALDRGSAVHGILKAFYTDWSGPVTPENRAEARERLTAIAEAAFRNEADTFRNRREKEIFRSVMIERFLDAETAFWGQGMRPAYLEQQIEPYRIRLADGRETAIRAKVDRIDIDDKGNFIIVDYKTGSYPAPKLGTDQIIFQLPVYAVMARAAKPAGGPALTKAVGLAYYDLSGRNGGGARDVVLFDRDAGTNHPAIKPKASSKSAGEFEEILARSIEKARGAIEGIMAGTFLAEPRNAASCRRCPNDALCRPVRGDAEDAAQEPAEGRDR